MLCSRNRCLLWNLKQHAALDRQPRPRTDYYRVSVGADGALYQNKAETARKKQRIKEEERRPERMIKKTQLVIGSVELKSLSQLSGWGTSSEPQWPADSPGFGAQRVGSCPPNNPQPLPPCHMHPSSHPHPTLPSLHPPGPPSHLTAIAAAAN